MKKEDMIKDMFLNLVEGAEKHTEVGELPKELKKTHRKMDLIRESLDERLELMRNQAEVEFNVKVRELLGEEMESIRKMKSDFWEQVYEHFNIDGEEHYTYDDGKIFKVEEVEREEAAEKLNEFEAKLKQKRSKNPMH